MKKIVLIFLVIAVFAISAAFTSCNKVINEDVILLKKYSHVKHNLNSIYYVYEYDAQYRITKRLRYYSVSDDIPFTTETLTYNADGILFKTDAETITFTKNNNKISYIEQNTSFEIEVNDQELPVKRTYIREGESGNWEIGTSFFTWKNGNLIQEDREHYGEEDGKEYEDSGTNTFTYDDKKSPFYNCTTPKWFLLFWLDIDYCSENNLETAIYSWNPTYTYIFENTYNDDGFLASLYGQRTVIVEVFDYMKR